MTDLFELFDIPYTFGWHINSAISDTLDLNKSTSADPDGKGYFLEAHGVTGEESSMFIMGRYLSNPNKSWNIIPNVKLMRVLTGWSGDHAEVEIDRIPRGTRLRSRVVYNPELKESFNFYWDLGLGWQHLGSSHASKGDFDINYLLNFKTLFNASRIIIGKLDGTLRNDFDANYVPDDNGGFRYRTPEDEPVLYDKVGSLFAKHRQEELKENPFNRVEAITKFNGIIGKFRAELGSTVEFETSPGFNVNQLTVKNDRSSVDLDVAAVEGKEDTYSITLPSETTDGVPHTGNVTLVATDGQSVFETPMELAPFEGFVVQEFKQPITINERGLTYLIGRHPDQGDQLLFDPTQTAVKVDKFNNLTLEAQPGWKVSFYIIDKGGLLKINYYSDQAMYELDLKDKMPEEKDPIPVEPSNPIPGQGKDFEWVKIGPVESSTLGMEIKIEDGQLLLGLKK